ncbi:MAG: CopD family protein [Ilumatobacter sp.]|uniref:CopD family protein n=1 Tax=Ilumatobacter sp. TaxID=1967498 RepID=UPI00329948F7
MIPPLFPLGPGAASGAGRRSFVRVLFAAVVSVIVLLGLAPGSAAGAPAAENTVVSSSPDNGGSIGMSPDAIIIVFAEELGATNSISVTCDGEPVTLAGGAEVVDDTTLEVEVGTPLPQGTCVASWAVTGTVDQPNGNGNITFIIENDTVTTEPPGEGDAVDDGTTVDASTPGAASTPDATTIPAPTVDAEGNPVATVAADPAVVDLSVAGSGNAAVWLGRLISTLGIATLFGSLLVITAAWPEGVEYLVTIKFLRAVWIVAMIGTLLYVAFASAAVTPDGGGGPFSPGTWADLLDAGWAGRLTLLRLVLLIASAWAAFRPDRAIDPTTQLVALGIPGLAAATLGISRTVGDLAALGVLMGVLHALAMSVWVGGVILLARVVLAGPGDEDLIHAVRGFGRISTPAIVVTIVTGLVQMFRLDGGELFQSGHGRVVVLKTVVVAVMIFVAFSARQFVAQRLNRAQQMSVGLSSRLRRAFGAEAAIGIVALVLSAWLLAFTPPNVDAVSRVDYAVEQTHTDVGGIIDVEVSFTDDTVGTVGMQVEVKAPLEGLTGLDVVLTAPDNPALVGYRQSIPITGPGFAVRDESVGFPLTVAGDWIVTVEANTTSGAVVSTPQIFQVRDADGAAVESVVTPPAVSIVEVPVTETPTTEA